MSTFEWLAECDACPWTGAHAEEDVAYHQLRTHNQAVHADTAKGRIIPFVVDGFFSSPAKT
jgi:hypothetical protein